MLYTPFSSKCLSFFLKICFPPSLGSMILKAAEVNNHAKKSFSGPPVARNNPIMGLFMAPRICKIDWKNVYFLFMDLLWKLCSHYVFYRMHFRYTIFTFSQCFRHPFAEKWTPLSEVTSHRYVRLTPPATYAVYRSP